MKDVWELKLKALESYSMEMRNYPHTRSYDGIKNLAKYRGNQVGLYMAEAFEIIEKLKDEKLFNLLFEKWFSKDFPYKKIKNFSFYYISKEDLNMAYLKK